VELPRMLVVVFECLFRYAHDFVYSLPRRSNSAAAEGGSAISITCEQPRVQPWRGM